MTVVHDRLGVNSLQGSCSANMYQSEHGEPGGPGCYENIVAGFAELGISEELVPFAAFNMFMNVAYEPDGRFSYEEPVAESGEYIEFRAEVQVALSISACPYSSVANGYNPKPLVVEIFSTVVT
jgi:uncharacterized protein YcgI (DUF1989 family)